MTNQGYPREWKKDIRLSMNAGISISIEQFDELCDEIERCWKFMGICIDQVRSIPVGMYEANRYDTDNESKVHLWSHKSEISYDISVISDEAEFGGYLSMAEERKRFISEQSPLLIGKGITPIDQVDYTGAKKQVRAEYEMLNYSSWEEFAVQERIRNMIFLSRPTNEVSEEEKAGVMQTLDAAVELYAFAKTNDFPAPMSEGFFKITQLFDNLETALKADGIVPKNQRLTKHNP